MKSPGLLFILLISVHIVFGQQKLITCSTQRNPDNSISIYADAQIAGEYTLKLIFTELKGFTPSLIVTPSGPNSQVALITVTSGKREVIRLTRQKSAPEFGMIYKYGYYAGVTLHHPPDSNFTYLFPGTEGNRLRVSNVHYFGELVGTNAANDFSAVSFLFKLGDTICASRAGMVSNCSDTATEGETANEVYKSGRNHIYIEQKDGTIAGYRITAPIQLLVQPGDYVIPGQPLAVINKPSEKYLVLFAVFYVDEKKAVVDNTNSLNSLKMPSVYSYVSTLFYLDAADRIPGYTHLDPGKYYTATHPKEIVGNELSKKDKKKLGL